ncbi:hypothetical protein [Streptomyces sp. NPDC000410]|uniref:hypothetical protein n=1 Tax=Streptomyces sp. NPDC000410 TaxID=3154254 RepID=UPI00332091B0
MRTRFVRRAVAISVIAASVGFGPALPWPAAAAVPLVCTVSADPTNPGKVRVIGNSPGIFYLYDATGKLVDAVGAPDGFFIVANLPEGEYSVARDLANDAPKVTCTRVAARPPQTDTKADPQSPAYESGYRKGKTETKKTCKVVPPKTTMYDLNWQAGYEAGSADALKSRACTKKTDPD